MSVTAAAPWAPGAMTTTRWEREWSEALDCLAHAHRKIEALRTRASNFAGSEMSLELASQSVWTAIVGLNECRAALVCDMASSFSLRP